MNKIETIETKKEKNQNQSHGGCTCGHCNANMFEEEHENEHNEENEHDDDEKSLFPVNWGILAAGLVMLFWAFFPHNNFYIKLSLSLIIYIYFGLPIIINMFSAIKQGDIWNENTLMTGATIGAFIIGEYADAAAVMLLYALGEHLQDMAFDKSKKRIRESILKNPDFAFVERDTEKGRDYVKVKPKEVKIGEIILVKPGEKIALDGVVIEGNAYCDNSAMTGESVPIALNAGSSVISGGIINGGVIKIKVEKIYSESAASLVEQAVKEASERKSNTEKTITRFSRIYTPCVFLLAVIVVLVSVILLDKEVFSAVKTGLIFLVISCPCALVLSIPLTYFAGIGAASKIGVLVKGGESLDAAANITCAVFDKTGTVTKSEIKVSEIIFDNNYNDYDLKKIYAIMEQSNHPLCRAFINSKAEFKNNNFKVENFEEIAGGGIKAFINGDKFVCGNIKFLEENNCKVNLNNNSGLNLGTGIYFAENNNYIGCIKFADELKESAKGLARKLNQSGISSNNIYLMSGDNEFAVSETAKKLGFKKYFAGLKPHEKMRELENIINQNLNKNKNAKTLFAGDGINDSAAIKRADVGVAVQNLDNNSRAASNAADIIILGGGIDKTAEIIKIAKKIRSVAVQNIVFAVGAKLAIMIVSAVAFQSMELAIAADVGVAALCVLNSMRVMRA